MAERESDDYLADEEAQAAAQEAAHIGGDVPSEEGLDPAQRPLVESGEGVAEGFELAEEDLIEHASHGDQQSASPGYHDRDDRPEETREQDGEADSFRSSETEQDW
jgi:hypothetical protein